MLYTKETVVPTIHTDMGYKLKQKKQTMDNKIIIVIKNIFLLCVVVDDF
jgi:hypothetical protein